QSDNADGIKTNARVAVVMITAAGEIKNQGRGRGDACRQNLYRVRGSNSAARLAAEVVDWPDTTAVGGTQRIIVPSTSIGVELIVGSAGWRAVGRRDSQDLKNDVRKIQKSFELLIALRRSAG